MDFRKNVITHLLWTIGVLVAIVSVLLWRLPNGNALSDYISFAAAIASLILATVAIFQSIVFANSFNSTVSAIGESSRQIVEETSRLKGASVGLSEEASKALAELHRLPTDIDDFRGEMREKISKLEFQKTADSEADDNEGEDQKWKRGSFLDGLPYYILAKSYSTGYPIDLEKHIPGDKTSLPQYFVRGFIEALRRYSVCGLVVDGRNGAYFVKSMGGFDPDSIISFFEGLPMEADEVRETFENISDLMGDKRAWPRMQHSSEESGETNSEGDVAAETVAK